MFVNNYKICCLLDQLIGQEKGRERETDRQRDRDRDTETERERELGAQPENEQRSGTTLS